MENQIYEAKKVEKGVERSFSKKDIIFTAIIAFLIGSIITASGFLIFNKSNKKNDIRNFKDNGIQRNIDLNDENNSDQNNGQNNKGQMMQRPDRNNKSGQNNTPPSLPNESNNQNTQKNQPNNQNSQPNLPNNNTNTENKS